MDLDQIIKDADPARDLTVTVPAPSHPQQSRHAGRPAVAVIVVAVCVVVLLVGLQIRGHARTGPSITLPRVLPVTSTSPSVGADVVGGTARIVTTFPDPDGGPKWGVRTFQTRTGMTCLQVGRTESGLLGGIGTDGAYSNDMTFHPFPIARTSGIGDCEPNDARGHAFINVDAINVGMSAAQQTCLEHDDALPREHCPASALRDVYAGLLGPDATSITYAADNGRFISTPTTGPDGAYLIVRPIADGTCTRAAMLSVSAPSSCDYDTQGEGIGANLRSGEITAVTYRDGQACHLPAPKGVVVHIAQCPVIGYVAAPGPKYSPATIAAKVTIRKLPSRFYCERPGRYRPTDLAIPCDRTVPKGYSRFHFTISKTGVPQTDPGQNLLIYVSWIAHAAVLNTQQSTYSIFIQYPKGCQSGGQGSGTQTVIRPGQKITQSFYIPTACHGTYTGQVTYTPDLGPNGENQAGIGASSPGNGIFPVGNFSFDVP